MIISPKQSGDVIANLVDAFEAYNGEIDAISSNV